MAHPHPSYDSSLSLGMTHRLTHRPGASGPRSINRAIDYFIPGGTIAADNLTNASVTLPVGTFDQVRPVCCDRAVTVL